MKLNRINLKNIVYNINKFNIPKNMIHNFNKFNFPNNIIHNNNRIYLINNNLKCQTIKLNLSKIKINK